MFEIVRRCDACGEKLNKEYRYDESPTKEWDLRGYDICTRCAVLIDKDIVAFRAKYNVAPVRRKCVLHKTSGKHIMQSYDAEVKNGKNECAGIEIPVLLLMWIKAKWLGVKYHWRGTSSRKPEQEV